MRPLIPKALNPAFFILLFIFLAGVQTSLFSLYPLNSLQPDLFLLGVIWLAFKRSFEEGGLLTFILAEITEVHTSAPMGLFFILYMATFLIIHSLIKYIIIDKLTDLINLTVVFSVASKLLGLLIISALGMGHQHWQTTLTLLIPQTLIQALSAVYFFRWLEKFDWITFKDPRAHEEGQDPFLLKDSEGR